MLAEWGDCREAYDGPEAVAALSGMAPVTRRSGRHLAVGFRWACNTRFRNAMATFADNSRHASAWAASVYSAAIARAVLLEPPVLLLDDPTASVDPETEFEILEAINRAVEGRTTFIVAHRLSTLARADRIVVLRGGRVVQIGRHRDLMKNPGLYREAIDVQAIDAESLDLLRQADARREEEGT